jgi:hypothetical protein
MELKEKAQAFGKRFKLDSHHAIERFGIVVGILSIFGAFVLVTTGAAAFQAGRADLRTTALYTESFTTSKTNLTGDVVGVYRNELGDRSLVVMKFAEDAQISYSAGDYQAFLLGSDPNLGTEKVETPGAIGSFHVFGATGYMAVLLDADRPFERQVLNLTMRANEELSFSEQWDDGEHADEIAGDTSFAEFDQWRVFFNPSATQARHIEALDSAVFDPAAAFYDVVVGDQERGARGALDSKLAEMRSDLARIASYSNDLTTTKVDGLFLRPPTVPASIAGDEVVGHTAAETTTEDDAEGAGNAAEDAGGAEISTPAGATLELKTKGVVAGGFNLDWRAGNVYDGYLHDLVPSGQSVSQYLLTKSQEAADTTSSEISSMEWTLSDGTSLTEDYSSSDVTMRPLMNVMNNLSQAYQDYYTHKQEYQADLTLALLELDVSLRDVQANSSDRDDEKFLVALY